MVGRRILLGAWGRGRVVASLALLVGSAWSAACGGGDSGGGNTGGSGNSGGGGSGNTGGSTTGGTRNPTCEKGTSAGEVQAPVVLEEPRRRDELVRVAGRDRIWTRTARTS